MIAYPKYEHCCRGRTSLDFCWMPDNRVVLTCSNCRRWLATGYCFKPSDFNGNGGLRINDTERYIWDETLQPFRRGHKDLPGDPLYQRLDGGI